MRKSAFKMYQVLRVGDYLIQSLLVTSSLYSPLLHGRGQTQDEEKQGQRGRDRPLLHKELAHSRTTWGGGWVEHLGLNQI